MQDSGEGSVGDTEFSRRVRSRHRIQGKVHDVMQVVENKIKKEQQHE